MVAQVAGTLFKVGRHSLERVSLTEWSVWHGTHRSVSLKRYDFDRIFFRHTQMSTPNYKLADNHAAAVGHVRELYAKVVAEFHEKNANLNM